VISAVSWLSTIANRAESASSSAGAAGAASRAAAVEVAVVEVAVVERRELRPDPAALGAFLRRAGAAGEDVGEPAAAWAAITELGRRPRSPTAWPFACAHARMSEVLAAAM